MKIIDAHLHLFPPEPRTDAMAEAVGHQNSVEHLRQAYGELGIPRFSGGTPERCRRICSPVGAGALTRPGACGYRPLRPFRQPGADVRQGFGTGQVNLIALDTEHLVSIS